ncbi:MAG: alpha-D-ribose 1-methylphosphonate 5-triphosphate diphosphatase [Hyphomicrobiaceae bacterium]|nr:alpha-D-ribose 1-methylphosphonate 5-triphosphate diphosphatase [Hyphomicrobiaceae bacterium]
MADIVIQGGSALIGQELVTTDVSVAVKDGHGILGLDPSADSRLVIDARGLLVLPGLVDVHGDAFERQLMPRPGVGIDLDIALIETDRQLVANGITTACHGVTRSWEPGLRDAANARALLQALERLRPRLAADTRFHLRHETYNLDGEAEILEWLRDGRIDVIAFNDHMSGTIKARHRPDKMAKMVERSGLTATAFAALVERIAARADEVPASIARIAAAAQAAGTPAMSHDDMSIDQRQWFARLGVAIAEFPLTEAVAEAAVDDGASTVFGAPNVLRGGSHTGCPDAAEMVERGWCRVLASDYFYPALLQAPFVLRDRRAMRLAEVWPLVSANAAAALGLMDRGTIADGKRADVVLVADVAGQPAHVVATIANGRLVHLADGERVKASAAP